MPQNYGLGRGLSSLIPQKRKSASEAEQKITQPEESFNYFGSSSAKSGQSVADSLKNNNRDQVPDNSAKVLDINIAEIVPNPFQPRASFDEAKLLELAQSIKEHGVIQPITVTKNGNKYELIAGERRFQAAKIAGLEKVPAIVREAGDQGKLELAVVENVQRENLSPIEEAKSYLKLTEEFKLTQEEIAKKLGKSRSAVANKIRLLNLPEEMQKALIEGKITEGHAKLLLAIPNSEKQKSFFDLILKNSLTVRQTETKAREISVKTHKRNITVDPVVKEIEDNLTETLGTKVQIKKSGSGGRIMIDYYSQEELNNILGKIK